MHARPGRPASGTCFQAITGSQVGIGNAGDAWRPATPATRPGSTSIRQRTRTPQRFQALCTAQGTPPGYTNNQPRPPSTTQGNLSLQPETANTFSVGTVIRPTFESPLLSKISLSVDYYSIDVSNTMGTIGANAVLDNCYTASTNPTYSINNEYCQLLTRSPTTGLLANISNPLFNLGEYKTSGVGRSGRLGGALQRHGGCRITWAPLASTCS